MTVDEVKSCLDDVHNALNANINSVIALAGVNDEMPSQLEILKQIMSLTDAFVCENAAIIPDKLSLIFWFLKIFAYGLECIKIAGEEVHEVRT